jgi:hypothetical protein
LSQSKKRKKPPSRKKPVKKAKGGIVSRYSKLSRPQKFRGVF